MDNYNSTKTLLKGATPLTVILIVELAYFILKLSGNEVPKDTLYEIGVAGYGGVMGLVNYVKNMKKKVLADKGSKTP